MITLAKLDGGNYEWRGLSTDTKPTPESLKVKEGSEYKKPQLNGSVFFEIDTAKAFMFDATSESWKEL